MNVTTQDLRYRVKQQKRVAIVFQVRIQGRGGQGVVTAAELLSIAAFTEGKHAQAFPSFGSERMGAPVVSFCRIDNKEIRSREPISEPDALIIQDTTLFHSVDVFQGLKPDGLVLINTTRSLSELGIEELTTQLPQGSIKTVGATELALKHFNRPVPNAALMGAFAAMSGRLSIESVAKAILSKFKGPIGEANVAAAREAFSYIETQA